MIKVCHLSTVHKRFDVRIAVKECSSLVAAGYEVHFIVADGKGEGVFQGILIHDIGKQSNRIKRMVISPIPVLFKALQIKAEVYHFHDAELIPAGLFLRLLGFKVIYDIHDDLPKQIMDKHYIPLYIRKVLSRVVQTLENLVIPLMSAIVITVTIQAKRFSTYHHIVRTIHNFPLLTEVANVNAENRIKNVICYIGGLTRIRGIIELLKAIKGLPVKLIIAGEFDPPGLIHEAKAEPGWQQVDYRGFVGRDEVADILSVSSIGMVTLLPNENYLASLPIKMFEYMGAAIPVIASDFPLWRQIIDNYQCGICVDPSNVKEISAAITFLLDNPQIAAEMGARGYQGIRNDLNWESQITILLQLYEIMVKK
jgi:glycosyltransferase involved in cell wall biosynthesis